MGNINVISIYRYHRKESIDMISILIFANIAIPTGSCGHRRNYSTLCSHKFCPYFKHLFKHKCKRYLYRILRKFNNYFKKDTSTVVTQNDRLLFAHSAANIWASYWSIHKSWSREFLSPPSQSQPSVSQDFGAFGRRHVPLAPTTIYNSMNWVLGWKRANQPLQWNLGCALIIIFAFFLTLWAVAESCWKPHSSLSLWLYLHTTYGLIRQGICRCID